MFRRKEEEIDRTNRTIEKKLLSSVEEIHILAKRFIRSRTSSSSSSSWSLSSTTVVERSFRDSGNSSSLIFTTEK